MVTTRATTTRTLRGATTARRGASVSPAAALKTRANTLLAERKYAEILANPDILALLRPPAIWEGSVTLPDGVANGARLRLVIREYERHRVDTDHVSVPVGAPDPRLRLVYAEVLAI